MSGVPNVSEVPKCEHDVTVHPSSTWNHRNATTYIYHQRRLSSWIVNVGLLVVWLFVRPSASFLHKLGESRCLIPCHMNDDDISGMCTHTHNWDWHQTKHHEQQNLSSRI